jgi:hypothetical protein
MLMTKLGAIDGITVKEYKKGVIYENLGHLAKTFVGAGWAEVVEDEVKLKTAPGVEIDTPAIRGADMDNLSVSEGLVKKGRRGALPRTRRPTKGGK